MLAVRTTYLWLSAIFGILATSCLHAAEPAAKPQTVRVAAIQFCSAFGKPAENRKGLETLVREAARGGARIVVLPETAIPGYMSCDLKLTWQLEGRHVARGLTGVSPKEVAETVPGTSTREFGAVAKELKIYLTVPLVEVDPAKGTYYNTLVLVGPDGQIVLHYRKLNPWPWAEAGWTTPGDRGRPVVDTPFGRIGLLVCYDLNSEPPAFKKLGVDHLLCAIAWVDTADSTWFDEDLPEIARSNNLNLIGANWTVPQQPIWSGYGHTRIIRRTGEVVARAKDDLANGIVYADLPIPTPKAKQ
jgi:predicted amidohydrolase